MMWYRFLIFSAVIILTAPSVSAYDTLKISAGLDSDRREVTGYVEYRVPPHMPPHESCWQLFANLYASPESPYLKGNRGLAEGLAGTGSYGETIIDSVRLNGQLISADIAYDDAHALLGFPGGAAVNGQKLRLFFKTRLPYPGDRLTYHQQEYILDGWMPMPVGYDNGEWELTGYGGNAEIVNDFFNFEVHLTVPDKLVTAAPSRPVAVGHKDTVTTYSYNFGPAHDFALALSPDYMIDSSQVGQTGLYIYYHAPEKPLLKRIKTAVELTFQYMQEKVGEYVYEDYTVVFSDVGHGGGVEIPGMTALSLMYVGIIPSRVPEMLVIHETIHQWFYAAVNSNQVTAPWMDEAITNFFTLKIMERHWGTDANIVEYLDFEFSLRDEYRLSSGLSEQSNAVASPAGSFPDETEYFATVYSRGALAIETIDNILGDSLSDYFWREYYRRYKLRRPGPDDFFMLLTNIAGDSAAAFAERLLSDNRTIDYAVDGFVNRRIDSATVEVELLLRQKGDLPWPITYRLIPDDNDTVDYIWRPQYNSELIVHRVSSPVTSVEIDPAHVFTVDVNRLNNSQHQYADNRPALRLTSQVMYLLETLFSLVAGI